MTTDHETIRRWAEDRGGRPTTVASTASDDAGVLRIDFPGYRGVDSLQPISWDEWFRKFDEKGLAFLCQDPMSSGQPSRFFKLVSRNTVGANAR